LTVVDNVGNVIMPFDDIGDNRGGVPAAIPTQNDYLSPSSILITDIFGHTFTYMAIPRTFTDLADTVPNHTWLRVRMCQYAKGGLMQVAEFDDYCFNPVTDFAFPGLPDNVLSLMFPAIGGYKVANEIWGSVNSYGNTGGYFVYFKLFALGLIPPPAPQPNLIPLPDPRYARTPGMAFFPNGNKTPIGH